MRVNPLSEARWLLESLDGGRLAGSPYDTAWVARVARCGKTVFPRAVGWLYEHQARDGSWGSSDYPYDRAICTLAATVALAEVGGGPGSLPVRRGVGYLDTAAPRLPPDIEKTIGFELLFPSLLDAAERAGVEFSFRRAPFDTMRERKLRSIPPEFLCSPDTPMLFFWEHWGDSEGVPLKLSWNGSVGASPSATAYLLMKRSHPGALEYLSSAWDREFHGGYISFHDYGLMNRAFVLFYLLYGGYPPDDLVFAHAAALRAAFGGFGIPFSRSFPVPDVEDTVYALWVMSHLNLITVDEVVRILGRYLKNDHFMTYPFETSVSFMANSRVLELLTILPRFPEKERMVEAALSAVRGAMNPDGSFPPDKFYISIVVNTATAIQAVSPYDLSLAERGVEWLLSRGRGATWGGENWSIEETATVLLAMLAYEDAGGVVGEEVLYQARLWLEMYRNHGPYHPQWLVKDTYSPIDIIHAEILSSLLFVRRAGTAPCRAAPVQLLPMPAPPAAGVVAC